MKKNKTRSFDWLVGSTKTKGVERGLAGSVHTMLQKAKHNYGRDRSESFNSFYTFKKNWFRSTLLNESLEFNLQNYLSHNWLLQESKES